MTHLLPLHQAQARLLDLVQTTTAHAVDGNDALGRYLAAPLTAQRTQPSADLSAMDGFAVAGSGPWTIIGESRCGAPFGGAITGGQAARISTGAHMPDGASSIVVVEDAEMGPEETVSTRSAPVIGRHIRTAGSDFEAGSLLLAKGTHIGPAQIALARMAGHARLPVHAAATVAILECGDELAADPAACAAHQIPAANGAMLRAMAASEHCSIATPPPVADDLDALMAAIDRQADKHMIVISGGASVGDHDLVRPALHKLGAEIDFWRVAIKPGKPLMVATRGDQLILGLPGNPVSSFVTGFVFMLPALRKMLGAEQCMPRPIPLECTDALEAGSARRTFTRAILINGRVTPIGEQGSGALGALAQAHVLIERPEHCNETKAGTYVPTYLLQNGGIA